MKANYKSRIYPIVLILIVYLVWQYRESNALKEVKISGTTMGTIAYHITYLDEYSRNFKKQIDSLLGDFNQSLSTYIPDSEISSFNREGKVKFASPYFLEVIKSSQLVFEESGGAFDPTIGQLIDAWGFGKEGFIAPDSSQVDSLLQYVGFEKIYFDENEARGLSPNVKLNFSAIAKGQAVDVVGNYLETQGIEHFLVEIGGEVVTKGKNNDDNLWAIGIELPNEGQLGGVFDAVLLDNQGMATSGNYRQFRIVNGMKVAHTIDPKTGFPKMETLLSATVLAPNCMLADAYATACMVLGLEKAKALILNDAQLEAYFIYGDEEGNFQTYISPGLEGRTVNALNSAN